MTTRNVRYLLFGLVFAWLAWQSVATAQSQMAGMNMDEPGTTSHQDHNSKHGGTFFMAMDNMHHLEGVLVEPGVFKVYLYDSHTKPLSTANIKKASGVLHLGDSKDDPSVPLVLSKDGKTLDAKIDNVKLPVTLTLLMRFPGMKPTAKPELFTFEFKEYSQPDKPATGGMDHPMHGM